MHPHTGFLCLCDKYTTITLTWRGFNDCDSFTLLKSGRWQQKYVFLPILGKWSLLLLLLDYAGHALQMLVSTRISWGWGWGLVNEEYFWTPFPRGSEPDYLGWGPGICMLVNMPLSAQQFWCRLSLATPLANTGHCASQNQGCLTSPAGRGGVLWAWGPLGAAWDGPGERQAGVLEPGLSCYAKGGFSSVCPGPASWEDHLVAVWRG